MILKTEVPTKPLKNRYSAKNLFWKLLAEGN